MVSRPQTPRQQRDPVGRMGTSGSLRVTDTPPPDEDVNANKLEVLLAILQHSGPLPIGQANERLAAAMGGSHGEARSVTSNALYYGYVLLSSDRVLSLNQDRVNSVAIDKRW